MSARTIALMTAIVLLFLLTNCSSGKSPTPSQSTMFANTPFATTPLTTISKPLGSTSPAKNSMVRVSILDIQEPKESNIPAGYKVVTITVAIENVSQKFLPVDTGLFWTELIGVLTTEEGFTYEGNKLRVQTIPPGFRYLLGEYRFYVGAKTHPTSLSLINVDKETWGATDIPKDFPNFTSPVADSSRFTLVRIGQPFSFQEVNSTAKTRTITVFGYLSIVSREGDTTFENLTLLLHLKNSSIGYSQPFGYTPLLIGDKLVISQSVERKCGAGYPNFAQAAQGCLSLLGPDQDETEAVSFKIPEDQKENYLILIYDLQSAGYWVVDLNSLPTQSAPDITPFPPFQATTPEQEKIIGFIDGFLDAVKSRDFGKARLLAGLNTFGTSGSTLNNWSYKSIASIDPSTFQVEGVIQLSDGQSTKFALTLELKDDVFKISGCETDDVVSTAKSTTESAVIVAPVLSCR